MTVKNQTARAIEGCKPKSPTLPPPKPPENETECRGTVHSETHIPDSSDDAKHQQQSQTEQHVQEHERDYLYCDDDYLYGSRQHIVTANHAQPSDLFKLRMFRSHQAKPALAGFMKRYGMNSWMQQQWLYRERAAIAAAHDCMSVTRITGGFHGQPKDDFRGIDLVNCGGSYEGERGQGKFYPCHQNQYCIRCSRWERLEPAKAEFVPAFNRAPSWCGLTIVGISDPEEAGIKIKTGVREDGTPIIKTLFRLTDCVSDLKRLPRFCVDPDWDATLSVAEAVFKWANFLTDNHYFQGLHMLADCSFTFFPDADSELGVGHTIHPHTHGYGNCSTEIDKNWAARAYCGGIEAFHARGALQYAYPDMLLQPAPVATALETAINYAIKPFKYPQFYLDALSHGCPITLLNYVFHQTVFGCETLFPVGCKGQKYGNMSQKSNRYIGVPQVKEMSRQQVKRFLAKGDNAAAWEIERYEKHLEALAAKQKRQGRTPKELSGESASHDG